MSPPRRKQLLIAFGIAMVAFDLVLIVIDQRLEATGGPSILGLEFAGSERRATQIMGEWGAHGQYLARLSLWIDFGFMLSYGTFFTLAALATRDFARERGLRTLVIAGIAAPFFAAAAPLFDAAENIVWLLVLGGHGGSLGPPFATACASLKFLLIGLAIVYVLWGLAIRLWRRARRAAVRREPDEPIQLVPPDPDWPARFERERAALEEAIGEWTCGGIHHVGSTAVPGLEAKPIIDILVGVRDLETARACFGPLAGLDYLYAPYLAEEMHWFCKPHPARRTHHLHLVPIGSKRYRDEIAFRDRLRADRQLAARYAALKRELAERHRDDREAYTEAKSTFVAATLRGDAHSGS
jgi:GrpB-like predicted nucleotidyltransferase (UPF0157 family)